MLAPLEVIKMVEDSYHKNSLPLNAVEGFIRQILGWREYIRGIYWAKMPGYNHLNYFNHNNDLPKWFWTGKTKMNCLARSITQSLTHSYAHHIQRLMVIGNFSLLAGVNPEKVHHWYLGIYIDAFEWVELPNTIGMSQYADGGFLASKPYVSSAAYINKMSNYCSSCSYNFKERIGENACPFNSMYWNFFERHKEKLSTNPRLGIVNSQLKKMNATDKDAIIKQAKNYTITWTNFNFFHLKDIPNHLYNLIHSLKTKYCISLLFHFLDFLTPQKEQFFLLVSMRMLLQEPRR